MNFIGFGNGKDGDLVVSSANTIINSYTSLSASYSAGDKVFNVADATNFAVGDAIIIHQSRGTGFGNTQKNRIEGKSGNQLTVSIPFDYGYGDDGGNRQAQIIRCPEYSSVKINNTASIAPTAWNGDIGGIIAYSCNGKTTVDGFFNLKGKGYRGGLGANDDAGRIPAYYGESGTGPSAQGPGGIDGTGAANGAGGGAGGSRSDNGAGGGGGGHANAGSNGFTAGSNPNPGQGGSSVGDAAFSSAHMGAGGGGGGIDDSTYGGQGGDGAGLLFADSYEFVINNSTGYIDMDGTNGTGHGDSGGGGGGASAGGAFIRAVKGDIGTDRIYARGGTGGPAGHAFADGGDGGPGSKGRARVEACTLSGSLGSSFADYSSVVGGKEWCGTGTVMM